MSQSSLSDESASNCNENEESSDDVKGYIVDKLVQKACDLLGYSLSDVSEGSSSPERSSDALIEEGENWPVPGHDDGSQVGGIYGSPVDAGSSSQSESQRKNAKAGGQPPSSTHGRPLPKATGKRKMGSIGDEPNDEDGESGNKRRGNRKPCSGGRRGPRFACPFYRKSPEIHGRNASCLWPGFNSVSRLK